jgi:hypothetical protein
MDISRQGEEWVEPSSKDRSALKVTAATKRLVTALEAIGFKSVKGRTPTLVMNLNDETEVILRPGVRRRSGSVLVDPVIAVNNTKLQARLLRSGGFWTTQPGRPQKSPPTVCHAYLGMLDSWGRLYVNNEEELEQAVHTVVRSVLEVGLPVMREYDSLDKARKLFQDGIARKKRPPVAVLFAREKLEGMEEH